MQIELTKQIRTNYKKNEIWKLERTKDYFIVNNSYAGIIVFNINFERVATYNLKRKEIIIEHCFCDTKTNRVVCVLEDALWYIDLDTKICQLYDINLTEKYLYLNRFYLFTESSIYLYTGSYMLEWDFTDNELEIHDADTVKPGLGAKFWKQIQYMMDRYYDGHGGVDYIDDTWIVFNNNNNNLIQIFRDEHIFLEAVIDKSKWYRTDISSDFWVIIDEFIINIGSIHDPNDVLRIVLTNREECLGAMLIEADNTTYLVLLLDHISKHDTFIRRYELKTEDDVMVDEN